MSACLFICVCMHVSYICLFICVHMLIYMSIYMYISCLCMCISLPLSPSLSLSRCISLSLSLSLSYTHTHTNVHTCMQAFVYTGIFSLSLSLFCLACSDLHLVFVCLQQSLQRYFAIFLRQSLHSRQAPRLHSLLCERRVGACF